MRSFFQLITLLLTLAVFGQDYEFIPDASDSLIAARLKSIEGEIPLTYNDHVKKYITRYTITNRAYTRKLMSRSTKYFPLFERYLRKYNLPDHLKYLAIIESGLNPSAKSRAAAVGLWQFIFTTGKKYDLDVSWYVDDRMDPEKATEAACRFLTWLYGYHGDWELALAAYNSGSGRVNKAIRRADDQRAYYSVYPYLPKETQGYVPKLVATIYAFEFAAEHNLFPESYQYLPAYDTIQAQEYVHLKTLALDLGLCEDDILALNPQIRYGTVPKGADKLAVRVPIEVKDSLLVNREVLFAKAVAEGKTYLKKVEDEAPAGTAGRSRVVHTVRSGDVLGRIASRYGVRVADIKAWNRLSSNLIRVGQKLNIYVGGKYKPSSSGTTAKKAPTTTSKPAAISFVPIAGQKTYYVQPGDTLWSISQALNVPIEQIKSMNDLSSDNIKPGQVLVVSGG